MVRRTLRKDQTLISDYSGKVEFRDERYSKRQSDNFDAGNYESQFQPYHGKNARGSNVDAELRQFIAWDGEGINLDGDNRPQSFTLFGCSTGDYISRPTHIHTFELLEFIISVGRKFPGAYHVGFAFGYDANMIVRSLSEKACQRLHRFQKVTLRHGEQGRYHIQFRPGKWFSVSKFGPNYHHKTNPHDKVTVRIFDLFNFFNKSFIRSYEELIGPVPDVVKEGKSNRGDFASFTDEYVQLYWTAEVKMIKQLADELRRRLYGAGLRITSWHGPGALASYALRKNSIKEHMAECPKEVRDAATYGYAGGRFEIYKLGRIMGPIYSLDINSAYPWGIARLPSLRTDGAWVYVDAERIASRHRRNRITRFGVYRVRLRPVMGDTFLPRAPGPLFHRDSVGNISFPWCLQGWYWSPEVQNLLTLDDDRYEILEGWEFVGSTVTPFLWVEEAYQQRLEWKKKGYSTQMALKLMLNSLYGKMAQRVGWNEETRKPPAWHQLEWAGWVTSHCRGRLWEIMAKIPFEHLIAVETDGLYTTYDPAKLGITASDKLGGWSIDVYDEILYVQSGMAWLRNGNCVSECDHASEPFHKTCAWSCKRRGLDAKTFSLHDCRHYLQSLAPKSEWGAYAGKTTRFIGLGSALNSSAPFKQRHCVWETKQRDINPGQGGKRIHIHGQCEACERGCTAYEAAHDMSIRSLAYSNPQSFPHDIPWEDIDDYPWRRYTEE